MHRPSRRFQKLIAVIVWLLLVGVVAWTSTFTPHSWLEYVLFAVISLVGIRYSDKILDTVFGKEGASLSFIPLETAPDSALLHPSQWVNMAWTHVPHPQNTLTAEFGVIKVHCEGGEIHDCTASVRCYHPISMHDNVSGQNKLDMMWNDCGKLNWFSESIRRNLSTHTEFNPFQLGMYLSNAQASLYDGDDGYLLLCYVLANSDTAVICGDMTSSIVGSFKKMGITRSPSSDDILKFKSEITFRGQGIGKLTKTFDVSVSESTSKRLVGVNIVCTEV